MDSDDDIYEPNEDTSEEPKTEDNEVKMEDVEGDVEEGEEEEDSSDDDINFITDAKARPIQPESSSQKKQSQNLEPPKPSATPQPNLRQEAYLIEKTSTPQPPDGRPGTDYPARHTSTLDVNGNPVHPLTGKPIQSTDFDTDFPTESTKLWRRPGSDITDFFNYGFDEFTWASYCLKQQNMPKEIKEINNQAEQMKAFVEGIPGGGAAPANAAMPGMPDEATMMQMMQGMMQSGMDPSQMDPQQMMQMMGGGGIGQGMGGQQGGFQAPTGPQGGYGGGGGGGGGGNYGGGGFGGRGRGRRGR
jgi:pre-mRNA 3'-end-processing factor FIP1